MIGGHAVPERAAALFHRMAFLLATETNADLVTGGRKRFSGKYAADHAAIEGFLSGGDVQNRVLTLIPEGEDENRFVLAGRVERVGGSRQARRFAMVNGADVVVTVGGSRGTGQIIELAQALEKPLLPMGMYGGASRECWEGVAGREIKELVERSFRSGADWIKDGLPHQGLDETAARAVDLIRSRLRARCFVLMPFDKGHDVVFQQIEKALAGRYTIVRADKTFRVGDVILQLRLAIESCDFAVAVITPEVCVPGGRVRFNENVMYELGLVDAEGKKVVLLCERQWLDAIPFDLSHRVVIPYETPSKLADTLSKVVDELRADGQLT